MQKLKPQDKHRLLIQCFLKMLQQRMERDKVENLSPVFIHILSKEELRNILKWLYLDKVPEHYDLETMSKQELHEAIGDDFHILSYTIQKWKQEIEDKITPQKVYDVLCQLQLETHYLMTKILADWDEYDYSNFRALSCKAGSEQPLYAVFESSIKEEEKYTAPPLSKYYKTEWEAQEELADMISQDEIQASELKLMIL
ncbi:hypothetical protein [Chryseobacterium sp. EO14]|uniref:hypothetical protein n=1 Tax=Chryseobacterium sp. EO14 TaxID=2950551 RepID=UPI00210C8695|nr:hypothetical protein [Chryseobacterium sp. EO14]MCQ4138793.1 hypothetical protein [Chryseobacterium sp. EO14]